MPSDTMAVRDVDGFSLASFEDESEPRVRDTDLAERLGYDRARKVRDLIARNQGEIERFGPIYVRPAVGRTQMPTGGVREDTLDENWLTFEQALLVAVLSRTPKAADVREALIRLAAKVRRGELVPATPSAGLSIEAAREIGRSIVEPILERFSRHEHHVDAKFDEHGNRIARLEAGFDRFARGKRREIGAVVKAAHVRACRLFGGWCPCCSVERVVESDGVASGEFDHYFAAQKPDVDHTWLICKRCHADFTYGRVERTERAAEFAAYSNRRRRLPGVQPPLPGVN